MKELSVEEKAHYYDRTIAKAKEYAIDGYLDAIAVDDIFSELKENKDEEIRKRLLEYFKSFTSGIFFNGIPTSDAIAWLEAQGEQKFLGFNIGDEITVNGQICKVVAVEQKPDDKVEPKFNEGDWIILNDNHNSVYQVEKIQGLRYYLRHYLGGTLSVHFDNELIRLWTIQDAKDGDVLVDEDNNIGIYKEIEGIYWDSYIYLGCDGKLRGFSIGGKHEQTDTFPATKEQRDKLEKAMADAGYRWNPDEKKMEKIGQKPADKVEPKFKVGDVIEVKPMKCQDKIFTGNPNKIVDITEKSYIFDDGKAYNIELQDGWKLSEQKPAEWTHKDGKKLAELWEILSVHRNTNSQVDNLMEWVKDLVSYKRQEWSEEDENRLSDAVFFVREYQIPTRDKRLLNAAKEAEEWLKSLKERVQPQNTWKPSEGQMKGIECAIKTLQHQLNVGDKRLNWLYDDLKKLKEEQL